MGLFNLFKKNNKNTISLPSKSSNAFIQSYTRNLTKINIGDKLIVEKGWSAVLVAKDTVLDVFSSGEFELNLGMIPKVTAKFKLDKGRKVKKGKDIKVVLPKSFLCDVYFVNHKLFENRVWKSYAIRLKSNDNKRLKFWVNGRYDVRIDNPGDAVGLFLIDWGYINSDKVLGKLDFLVSEICTDILQKNSKKLPEEMMLKEYSETVLLPKIEKQFSKYGLVFSGVGVENIIYPRNVEVPKKEEEPEYVPPVIKPEKINYEEKAEKLLDGTENSNNIDKMENEVKRTKKQIKKDKEELEKSDLETIKSEEEIENVNSKIDSDSVFDNVKMPDLSKGRRKKNLKICAKCNSILPVGSKFCPQCGQPTSEEDLSSNEQIVCPKCKKENKAGTLFCECGCYLPPKDVQ